jgi:hypothetical protein
MSRLRLFKTTSSRNKKRTAGEQDAPTELYGTTGNNLAHCVIIGQRAAEALRNE